MMLKKLIRKYYQRIRVYLYKSLSNNDNIQGKPNIYQPTLFIGNGQIQFKNNVSLGYFPSPFFYNGVMHIEARRQDACIKFGNNIFANNNLCIICEGSEIEIGDDVLIGFNVEIIDSDFHELHPLKRNSGNHKCRPVKICDNVFIGSNVKILKGVTIGKNSVVANGAIVTESFPENVIIGGNPAIIIKKLNYE